MMPQPFHVLQREQEIHNGYFLEASAGTGKTFTIENLVVRLLIEPPTHTLPEILVVTFTRAATRELRLRIHQNIQSALAALKQTFSAPFEPPKVDYLSKIFEEGTEAVRQAIRALERALCGFDAIQVFTIHGFCAQMLREHLLEGGLANQNDENEGVLPKKKLEQLIKDFYRTGAFHKNYSNTQLSLLLNHFRGDLDVLGEALLYTVEKGTPIMEGSHFNELLAQFQITMHQLKYEHQISEETIVQHFTFLASYHKGNCDRSKQIKPEILERIGKFAKLFSQEKWEEKELNLLIADQLFIVDALAVSKRLKSFEKIDTREIPCPELTQLLHKTLFPYVSVKHLFARLADDCKEHVERYKRDQELLGYQDLLTTMRASLEKPSFVKRIQEQYCVAVIDEFQDTDPLQWEIFETLFLHHAHLYLVGDPKQSIYAFRQADIYTYLRAGQNFPQERHASLDTNFRSHKPLIDALNTLFSPETTPEWLVLPRTCSSLQYPYVKSSPLIEEKTFCDELGAVHFFVAENVDERKYPLEKEEERAFFPFIAAEILKLTNSGEPLSDIAILVADRYQGFRIASALKKQGIPIKSERSSSLTETAAFSALKELLKAIFKPSDENLIKIALGGKIFRWREEDVRGINTPEKLSAIIDTFTRLKRTLLNEGLLTAFRQLLHFPSKNALYTIQQSLLFEEGGDVFFDQLQQIIEILTEETHDHPFSSEHLLKALDHLQILEKNEDERLKQRSDPEKEAVQLMTMHASKGLEFSIVFALGTIKRPTIRDLLIPKQDGDMTVLAPYSDAEDSSYTKFCEELDAEKLRQLYVTFTRAKYRLYLPVIYAPKSQNVPKGSASPMDLFLSKLGRPLQPFRERYTAIGNYTIENLKSFVEQLPDSTAITLSVIDTPPKLLSIKQTEQPPVLIEPFDVIIPGTPYYVHSFSSLAQPLHQLSVEVVSPRDFHVEEKSPFTLPASADTGMLLHCCLEHLLFEQYRDCHSAEQLRSAVAPFLNQTPYEPWMDVVTSIVFHCIKTPLNGQFSLSELQAHHYEREAEFFYESNRENVEGYIKGFIDLFFEHEGKYYLLDWKSHWLGSTQEAYRNENLRIAMEQHDYFLQAKIYVNALKKYLNLIDKRPFEECFGGVFYVFMRGVLSSDPAYGQFFISGEGLWE